MSDTTITVIYHAMSLTVLYTNLDTSNRLQICNGSFNIFYCSWPIQVAHQVTCLFIVCCDLSSIKVRGQCYKS